MTCKHLVTALFSAAAAFGQPAWSQAANADLGRNLTANCAACHGMAGSRAGGIPSLAGQPRQTLIQAMTDFREGKRPATIMHQLAKGYSAEQIERIAAFLADQKAQ